MADRLAEFRWDPLGCVLYSYPWGEGELGDEPGPRKWQHEFLEELGAHLEDPRTRHMPFRKAVSSGHGIGKSALIAWLVQWGKSTCIDTKILITADTGDQLKTKTQPEVAKWLRLAINKDWFDVHVQAIKINDAEHAEQWRADFVTWSEENPQAFAGAHNKGKRLIIIFDEAAGISDTIYETVLGALTDKNTEIIWLLFSQATRSEGAFYEACFGRERSRWRPMVIDSREVEGINVKEIEETIALYGEDSDTVRVRYRGLYPVAGGGRYIDADLVRQAQQRRAYSLPSDALVGGVDFAWGGEDDNVIRLRKGLDARSYPVTKVKGEFTRDPAVMIGKIVDLLGRDFNGERIAMLFFDSAGIAAPVEAGVRALGYGDRIMVVNFGADSIDPHYVYMRDYMWGQMKSWLQRGGAIDPDPGLEADLQKPVLVSDRLQRVKLESKDDMKKRLKRMGKKDVKSPDDGDALALTFAHPVAKPAPKAVKPRPRVSQWS